MTTRGDLQAFLSEALPTLRAIEAGDLSVRIPEMAPESAVLGALITGGNALVDCLEQARQRTRDYQVEIEQQIGTIDKQREAIRELSTPIIEVWTGVVCVPIIGVLDTERAAEMTSALLEAVARRKASLAIVDVTGIDDMDTSATDHFLRMAGSVRLLGADCVLSGINPSVAWTITQLEVDLGEIRTHRTLREALHEYVRGRATSSPGRNR